MRVNFIKVIFLCFLISGCAEREIDIIDNVVKIVGGCNAGFDWHLYGLQDSINYMLYECAKESIENGYTISDKSLLDIDFTLPEPLKGKVWNKKLAMDYFSSDKISEQKLGYILAAIEYEYQKVVWPAEDDLAAGKISEAKFNQIVKKAKLIWLGE